MSRLVDDAKRLAFAAHDGQFDKSGQPYIGHPARVAAGTRRHGGDDDIEIVAWLHDVVEDTDVTLDVIEQQFGSTIARAIDSITRRPDDSGDEYYHRVAGNPIALAVKRSDIEDNLDPSRTKSLIRPLRGGWRPSTCMRSPC